MVGAPRVVEVPPDEFVWLDASWVDAPQESTRRFLCGAVGEARVWLAGAVWRTYREPTAEELADVLVDPRGVLVYVHFSTRELAQGAAEAFVLGRRAS